MMLSATFILYVSHQHDVARVGLIVLCQFFLGVANMVFAMRQTSRYAIQPPLVRTASMQAHLTPNLYWVGYLAATLPLIFAAVYLHLHWNQIPETFPVHWGADGQPNRWAIRCFSSVYGMLIFGAVNIGIMMGLSWMRSYAAESSRRMIQLVAMIAAMLVSALMSMLALQPFLHLSGLFFIALMIAPLMLVVVAAFLLDRKRRKEQEGQGEEPYDGTPDECWYLGLIYFNPKDPAIWVEKRLGFGQTCNFARPATWPFLALGLGAMAFSIMKAIHN